MTPDALRDAFVARAGGVFTDPCAFSRWTRARWRIGNPLVEDPEVLEMLVFALNWS